MSDFSEKKYYNFEEMIKWMNFAYFLRDKYPFNRKDLENIKVGWGMLVIPRKGIEDTIKAQLRGDEVLPLKEIHMLFQLPFVYNNDPGVINKNISLTFRYDKEYLHGDINKNIGECCYFIDKWATKHNDFYILDNEMLFEFMSYYVIDNQWALGKESVSNLPTENLGFLKEPIKEII